MTEATSHTHTHTGHAHRILVHDVFGTGCVSVKKMVKKNSGKIPRE